MYYYQLRKSAPLAALFSIFLAIALLGGSAAHAQTALDPDRTAAQLGVGAIITAPYSDGTPSGIGSINTLPSPYQVMVGGQTVTFKATQGSVFESLTNAGQFDFASGTQLLDTFDPNTKANTGPLDIDFSSGVSAFGLQVQSARDDFEQFTVKLYKSVTDTQPFYFYRTPVYDNTTGSGKSVFLGVQSRENAFAKVEICSSSSTEEPATGNNDFYFGPLSVMPVPEASTVVSLGMALALLGGLTRIGQRGKKST